MICDKYSLADTDFKVHGSIAYSQYDVLCGWKRIFYRYKNDLSCFGYKVCLEYRSYYLIFLSIIVAYNSQTTSHISIQDHINLERCPTTILSSWRATAINSNYIIFSSSYQSTVTWYCSSITFAKECTNLQSFVLVIIIFHLTKSYMNLIKIWTDTKSGILHELDLHSAWKVATRTYFSHSNQCLYHYLEIVRLSKTTHV